MDTSKFNADIRFAAGPITLLGRLHRAMKKEANRCFARFAWRPARTDQNHLSKLWGSLLL